ncbi:MAG TPA: Calx-beta domain-containing protein [Candidatus Limnocylindrales bacterium]|nr:Calx-beta domain-containing protein [Candidatus Limnocylindrales bacterium]
MINDIDVVSDADDPQIDVSVDDIKGPTNSPGNANPAADDDAASVELAEDNPATFEFDILHKFPPTDLQILNLKSGIVGNSDVWLDGDIENPIGRTYVKNERGNIFSDNANDLQGIESTGVTLVAGHLVAVFGQPGADTDVELVRTNKLELDADVGSIGRQQAGATPRVAIVAEVIRFKHQDPMICPGGTTPCLFPEVVQAEAAGDLVLDLTFNERSLTVAQFGSTSAWSFQVDYLIAGDDVDVVINDSIGGTNQATVGDVEVNLFDPPSTTRIESGAGGVTSFADAESGNYLAHFRPDFTPTDLMYILRAFATSDRVKKTSTITFGDAGTTYGDVRAGDDIKICHVAVRNYTAAGDFGSATVEPCDTRNVSTLGGYDTLAAATATVHFVVFADTGASLIDKDTGLAFPAPPFDNDDGIGIDVPQLFLFTNGSITATELNGDMPVGHVESTGDDVTLTSPKRIVDSDAQVTIDVAGANITMTAGTAGDVGGIGLPAFVAAAGGAVIASCMLLICGGFLEINTRRSGSTGVLRAFDTAADDTKTLGIYLDEIVGDLPVHTAWTAGSAANLATGNVSLRTVAGSIIDGKHAGSSTDDAEILGQTVDLDANGGSIGTSGNDLEIDSSIGSTFTCTKASCADLDSGQSNPGLTNDAGYATDDVALEGSTGIWLTETDGYLRLVFAHAPTGDIRLTVRETSPDGAPTAGTLDEDLYLLKSGTARFAESNTRLPSGDDLDAERFIPKGLVFAEAGNVLLRVGDDVATHQNTEILADLAIDLYGDYGNADAGYGSNVVLRGRIVADCVVTPGASSGHPVGSCAPTTANPVAGRITQVWGNTDIDTFQLGDPSGLAGGEVPGDGISTWASDGFILLGSKTIVRGTAIAPVCGTACLSADVNPYASGDPKNLDEDRFTVWYLQGMNVVTDPLGLATTGAGAGQVLTLDGQSDTDYYRIFTTGSHGADRNYVINVLDTGAPDNGADELGIYGVDNTAAAYNGYAPGSTTRNATDDLFLLRAVKCLDNEGPYGVTPVGSGIPTTCTSASEVADRPAFVALLTGNTDPDGGVGLYRDRITGNEPSTMVQRINYDAALNGRITVFGLAGNDAFYVDDTSAIATLDGGAGYDLFQIGQIFGAKRDSDNTEGALLPQDTFPTLVATTRGWLSPGPHAPLVATGGTGNDEFIVYSNQAELRLEGDDDNDLFIVRAFALAAVCDTDADGIAGCQWSDVSLAADPGTGLFPVDGPDADHICSAAENPGYAGAGWNPLTGRKDNLINGKYDGVCNNADAETTRDDALHTRWEDDVIPLDPVEGNASPKIGLGFAVARPIDIRAGGGEDEVQYNVNAPVSVDGGTGFDKLVVLGTEFADDFAITAKAIYGAGLNVRYTTVEVIEVDGLEGDDQFFVQSTAFGVAYRVIGGLGSDVINVTGDVTADIVTRELEGLMGTIDHRVTSPTDPLYNGLPADGLDYNLATPDLGVVVIRESGSGTAVREGGSLAIPEIDYYDVWLAFNPNCNDAACSSQTVGRKVYVTVSAARAPQQEADGSLINPAPLPNGLGDTIWLCVGTGLVAGECNEPSEFQRHKVINGVLVDEAGRAVVLTFDSTNWTEASKRRIYLWAVDELGGTEIDPRSEGKRVVVIQHSVISNNPLFDGALVRNVEATVYDNDTPGIFISEISLDAVCPNPPYPALPTCTEDGATVVVEGFDDPAVGGAFTDTKDDLLVQLAMRPADGQVVVVKVWMDAKTQQAISLGLVGVDSRWSGPLPDGNGGTYYKITFRDPASFPNDWETPIRIRVSARDDGDREDPQTAVIRFDCDPSASAVCGIYNTNPADGITDNATATFQFPNLRAGPALQPVLVHDDETAGVIVRETGTDTVVVKCGDATCSIPGTTDDYSLRLTKRPENPNDLDHNPEVTVEIAILTDGLADVYSVNGVVANYNAPGAAGNPVKLIGGYVPSRLFLGNLTFGTGAGGRLTLTRANGSETGSFIDEGFRVGQLIRISGPDPGHSGDFHVYAITDLVMTLVETSPAWTSVTTTNFGTAIARLTRQGQFEGKVVVEIDTTSDGCTVAPYCRRLVMLDDLGASLTGTTKGGWLSSAFLEGQRIQVCSSAPVAACTTFKIAIIRGDNKAKDNKIQLTAENAFPAGWTNGTTLTVTVTRIAAFARWDDGEGSNPADSTPNWFVEQRIILRADLLYSEPITRSGVKIFPAQTHILSKLQGPLAVEGGVTGADRSLNLGVKLPGEKDKPLFKIGPQPPESKQIDVLNVFNDGSQQDRIGGMTSTGIKGLGMADDLDFGPTYSSGNSQTFGEPAVFPGGISFGTVQFVDGKFMTDGAKSTVEVVNVLLGQGNDIFQVLGTLDPDVAVKLIGSIILTPRAAGTLGAGDPGGLDLSRSQPFDWKAQGFLVGQIVQISGLTQTWKVRAFSDAFDGDTTDNTVMHLELVSGVAPAPPLQPTSTASYTFSIDGYGTGGKLTRTAGSWAADGFAAGQQLTIAGVTGQWLVLSVTDLDLLIGYGPGLADATSDSRSITRITPTLRTTIAEDIPVLTETAVTIANNDLNPADEFPSDGGVVTRTSGSWITDGFEVGQWVMIAGIPGVGWRLMAVTATTLTLDRGSPLPNVPNPTPMRIYVPGPHGGLTMIHGGGNMPVSTNFKLEVTANSVIRKDGLSWANSGYAQLFANGLPQHIQVGGATQTRTIAGFSDGTCPYSDPFPGCGVGAVMTFNTGTNELALTPYSGTAKTLIYVAEPIRRTTSAPMNITVNSGASPSSTLTCASACNFLTAGFKVGMQVVISGKLVNGASITELGLPGQYTIVGLTAVTMTLANVALQPTYRIVNDTIVWTPLPLTVTGYDPLHPETIPPTPAIPAGIRIGGDAISVGPMDVLVDVAADRITSLQRIDWRERGFAVGQTVTLLGQTRVIKAFADSSSAAGAVMIFETGGLTPAASATLQLGVVGALAGPTSPLVVYGDTSQDGAWYAGRPDDVLGYEFGPKPFDPFTKIVDEQNEDDEWMLPLANPYVYAGNDVIDARRLFADVACDLVTCALPSVGFTAYGGAGNDVIFGSQTGDHLAGGSGDDEIHGLRGADHIYGDSGVNVTFQTRGLTISTENSSPLPTVSYAGYTNNGTTIEPSPSLVADDLAAGRDLIYGEGVGTLTGGPQTAYDDVIFGDHGAVIQQVMDPNLPDPRRQKIQTTLLSSVRAIESRAYQNGSDDTVFGNLGRDVILGGAGNDLLDGNEQDDVIFGDQAFLARRVTDPTYPSTSDWISPVDVTSGRFQTLCGTLLYSRSDRTACGTTGGSDTSGALLVDGTWRDYRDPDSGSGGIDPYPWWAEYLVEFWDGDPNNHLHDFVSDDGTQGAGSFGNDHIAGGPGHDQLFGQLGDDILEGDAGIERAFARMVDQAGETPLSATRVTIHSSASRSPNGCDPVGGGVICDYVGDLDIVTSFEAGTDGDDYIEGNGGDDTIFGGLGQDDILGGSSDFFSLGDRLERPDGSDRLFGGAGTRIGRNDDSDLGPTDLDHARDADTIVGDNGRIIRIVGTNGTDVGTATKYVTFNYDAGYGTLRLIVRGVHLLDYTPGGPDFQPDLFFPPNTAGVCSSAGSGATSVCSTPLPMVPGRNSWTVDIGGHDEIHGEAGDDTAYGQVGNDVLYGDAQDDDLVGGWGNDWISGGTGQDGVIGDDGRIFTSRNTGCSGANCWQDGADLSEPLYGIEKFLSTDPDTKVIHGYVLNEFIYTPGQVQTATINVGGTFKKEVDITPYNLGPNLVAGHFQVDLPLFDANNSDDVIFGGWDDDFLHGASGDDAIVGGEALPESYVQHFGATGIENGLVRTDWTRPWNPGNLLYFGADTDPWNAPKPFVSRLGEFYLYDEYDPRRAILFDASGVTWGCTAYSPSGHTCTASSPLTSFPYQYFLNLLETDQVVNATTTIRVTEGRVTPSGCIQVANNGTCLLSATVRTDGNDLVFGDLGNDWMVGGSGRDDLYAGWGNDLSNADDILSTNGWLNDTSDTHPTYYDRVYGGAGIDILIGNTAGDRLIDWVGEWNSYIVPFSPFGIDTVSRQVLPSLPEFLYALSASDGADPTRDYDTGAWQTRPGRNGEYEGELGLVIQQDQGHWQQQTGGPTDPQPGNIPGGARDNLRGADFNSGTLQGFAVDSGIFEVSQGTLKVAASSLGLDAAAVFYVDKYLPIYFEVSASILTQKAIGGWKSNAYVIFDYWSPVDFKFAGIDVSLSKIVMGHRDATGWHVDVQAPYLGSLRADTFYSMLVAVNGTAVTVLVDGRQAFTHTFPARMLNGVAVGLNKGLVGMGSDNSRGVFDNVVVQTLPPQLTLDETETFDDGVADRFVGGQTGSWSVGAGRFAGTSVGSAAAVSLVDYGIVGAGLQTFSYVELSATVRTAAIGGIVFDGYGTNDARFAALDIAGQRILIGHLDPRRGFVIDASVARTLVANQDYLLGLVLRGSTVSVSLNGALALSFSYNAAIVDGRVGTVSQGGTSTFDSFRIRTDDPAFGGGAPPPPPDVPYVNVESVSIVEGTGGTVTIGITISLSQASATTVSVPWFTADGSAVAGVDYTAASGTMTFNPGETSKLVLVTIAADALVEPDEAFTVRLGAPTGANLGTSIGTVTILNDDTTVVSIGGATAAEGNAGATTVTLTLTISNPSSTPVSVAWATSDGTAVAGSDYVAASGTVTFAAGATSAMITLSILGDTAFEATEAFGVTLSSPQGLTIGTGSATVTITNDDAQPTVSLAATDASAGEAGSNVGVFTITRAANLTGSLVIGLAWSGTASTADYSVSVSGGTLAADRSSITMSGGVASATITITPVDDTAVESAETVSLALVAGTGYGLASPTSGSVSIADNDVGAAPTISIADRTVTEDNKNAVVQIAVTLSAPSSVPISVTWTTVAGTAVAGADFVAASGTLTFSPGVTQLFVNVTVVGDRTAEPTEAFSIVLSAPTGGATLDKASGEVTILDNDRRLGAATLGPDTAATPLSITEAGQALEAALASWRAAGADVAALGAIALRIVDLEGTDLAEVAGSTIVLDIDAAGWGWSVGGSAVAGRIDLETALRHEIGHLLGLEHGVSGPAHALMAPTLAPGVRLEPFEAALPVAPPAEGRASSGPWRAPGVERDPTAIGLLWLAMAACGVGWHVARLRRPQAVLGAPTRS